MGVLNKLFVAILVLLALSIVGYQYFGQKGMTLRFSELDIEQRLKEHLPFRKKALLILEFEFDQPEIDFIAVDERISVSMQISLEVAGKLTRDGLVKVSGVPSYRASEGAFYLSEPRVDELSFDGLSSKYSGMASNAITGVVQTLYYNQPLYELDSEQTKQKIAKLVLRDISVTDTHLIAVLGSSAE